MVNTDGGIERAMPDQPFPIGRLINLSRHSAEPVVLVSVPTVLCRAEFAVFATAYFLTQVPILLTATPRMSGPTDRYLSCREGFPRRA